MKSKKPTSLTKRINERTKKGNEVFDKLNKSEKRVAIAKDVIKSLNSNKFSASSGTYFNLRFKEQQNFLDSEKESDNLELQTILKSEVVTCDVCAIGGIFASKVNLGNKCKVNVKKEYFEEGEDIDTPNDQEMVENLKTIFGEKELRAIEYAFEGQDIDETFSKDEEFPNEKYEDFYDEYDDDTERMIAIMKNIIKNKGTFKL